MTRKGPSQVPLVDYLRLGERPHLRSNECVDCGARFFDRRNGCASCGGTEFRSAPVENRGVVRAFTIVHRAAPDILAPYVSAIIETEDGTSVRSNVVNCDPTPEAVTLGMSVRLVVYPIGRDDNGTEAIAFGYEPTLNRRARERSAPRKDRPMNDEARSGDSVWVLGTHMTRFGRYGELDAVDLAAESAMAALADGGVSIHDMDVLAAGTLFQASTGMGQRIQKQIGQTGIPVYNVSNACATGATALRTVHMAIKAGEAQMGLAVGVEQMGKIGLLGGAATKKEKKVFEPGGRYGAVTGVDGHLGTETMPGVFAQAGMEYAYANDGVGFEQFARVAYKNHLHSTLNPLAQYQKEFSLEEVMESPVMSYPNTLLMCCPTGDGAASVVLVSGERLASMPAEVRRRAVKVSASVLTSDPYTESAQVQPDVNTLTRDAAARAYERAGVGPEDLDLVELHDCFATAELIHYDNLGLCERGGAGEFIDSGAPFRDGPTPVNVSGGLISKGHPIGATGVANIYEVTTHLRGEAGDRQIEGAKVGLAHVIGLGSACGVHILERAAV